MRGSLNATLSQIAGQPAIYDAASGGHTTIVQMLLENKADAARKVSAAPAGLSAAG